jgi:hypothetical protein
MFAVLNSRKVNNVLETPLDVVLDCSVMEITVVNSMQDNLKNHVNPTMFASLETVKEDIVLRKDQFLVTPIQNASVVDLCVMLRVERRMDSVRHLGTLLGLLFMLVLVTSVRNLML